MPLMFIMTKRFINIAAKSPKEMIQRPPVVWLLS